MREKTVIYAGPFSFPNGGAAARRILGVCSSIKEAGFDVIVASGQMESAYCKHDFKDIPVVSLNERKHEGMPALLKHIMYFNMGSATVKWLDTLAIKPKAIILYSGYSPYLLSIGRWCKKNRVKLIFDAVEWYEAPSIVGRLSPYHLNIALAMNVLLPRLGNLICISSFLERYYENKGCHVIRIPPTLDVQKTNPSHVVNSVFTKISYTGNPGKKDLLEHVVKAVIELNDEGFPVQLNLAGNCEDLVREFSLYETKCIVYHGLLPHEASLELVRNSDYTVLFRPQQRSSEAGFSTKFVESISLGTPVLGNITSDLSHHLMHGETGFVSESVSYCEIKKTIQQAIDCVGIQRFKMRERCIQHAAKHFDYRTYTHLIKRFLEL